MKRIIFGGSMNPNNKGDQARIRATVMNLTEDGDIELALLSHHIEGDKRAYGGLPIEIVKAPWSGSGIRLSRMGLIALLTLADYGLLTLANRVLGLRLKRKLHEYDALVITSGFDFSDFAGRWPIYYAFFLTTLFGIVMGKPVMCYAQSMGPIENRIVRRLSRFFLNRMKTISVREKNSLAFLRQLDVRRPAIHLNADPAFLIEPNRKTPDILDRYGILKTRRPLIALSFSSRPFAGPGTGYCSVGLWFKLSRQNEVRLSSDYIQKMARICDRLIGLYGATLVFVPNCTAEGDDDRESMKRVIRQMSNQNKVVCITDDITLSNNMELIGACDLFVGTRLHAGISAAIMCVPLVALVGTDGPRVPGIMKMLGLENYVCNIMTDDENLIMAKISEVWKNRREMRRAMQIKAIELRERAQDNIRIFRQFCSLEELFEPVAEQPIASVRIYGPYRGEYE